MREERDTALPEGLNHVAREALKVQVGLLPVRPLMLPQGIGVNDTRRKRQTLGRFKFKAVENFPEEALRHSIRGVTIAAFLLGRRVDLLGRSELPMREALPEVREFSHSALM